MALNVVVRLHVSSGPLASIEQLPPVSLVPQNSGPDPAQCRHAIHRPASSYTVLRYVHDVTTAEFVNVGVVVLCPQHRFLGVRFRHTHRRLSALFPDLDSSAFRVSMTAIEHALKSAGDAYKKDDLFRSDADAMSLARSVLPADDSSL